MGRDKNLGRAYGHNTAAQVHVISLAQTAILDLTPCPDNLPSSYPLQIKCCLAVRVQQRMQQCMARTRRVPTSCRVIWMSQRVPNNPKQTTDSIWQTIAQSNLHEV